MLAALIRVQEELIDIANFGHACWATQKPASTSTQLLGANLSNVYIASLSSNCRVQGTSQRLPNTPPFVRRRPVNRSDSKQMKFAFYCLDSLMKMHLIIRIMLRHDCRSRAPTLKDSTQLVRD